jgi:hypothetical protein
VKKEKEFVMKKIECKIEILRQRMHAIALEKGMSHPDVLKASKILDEALNQFYSVNPYNVYLLKKVI